MSFSTGKWAHKIRKTVPGITPVQHHVLLQLVSHKHHKTGRCYPSIKTLAEETGYAPRSIIRAIQGLEKLGVIKKQYRANKQGKRTSTQYFFNAIQILSPSDTESPSDEELLSDTESPSHNDTKCQSDTYQVTQSPFDSDTESQEHSLFIEVNKEVIPKKIIKDKKANKKTTAPDVILFTETHYQIAKQYGLDITKERANYLDHHKAKGTFMVDWSAGFNTWLRKAADFKPQNQTAGFDNDWYKTDKGIEAKAKELGVNINRCASYHEAKQLVFEKIKARKDMTFKEIDQANAEQRAYDDYTDTSWATVSTPNQQTPTNNESEKEREKQREALLRLNTMLAQRKAANG